MFVFFKNRSWEVFINNNMLLLMFIDYKCGFSYCILDGIFFREYIEIVKIFFKNDLFEV